MTLGRSKLGTLTSLLVLGILCLALAWPTGVSAAVTLSPPSNLKAELFSTYAQISWTDSADGELYTTLERSIDYGPFTGIYTFYPGTTSYKDYSITSGHLYQYRARNIGSSTISNYSNMAELFYIYPTSLNITKAYSSGVTLSWSYPTLSTSIPITYETVVERKLYGETNWTTVATLPFGITEYEDQGLLSDSYYYYRIRTKFTNGSLSVTYPSDSGITTRTTIPLTSVLWGYALSDTQIMLQWDTEKLNGSTVVIEKMDASGSFSTLPASSYSDFYTDSYLVKGNTYTYRLYLISKNGMTSERTENVSISTEILPAPSNLVLTGQASGKIALSFKFPYDVESGFEVWRKEETGLWQLMDTLPKNTTEWMDYISDPGKKYNYRVRALRGSSAFSAFLSSQRFDNSIPSTPPDVVITFRSGLMLVGGKYSAPSGVRYTLEYRNSINEDWKALENATGGMVTTLFTPITGATTDFRIAAEQNGIITYGPIRTLYPSVPVKPLNFKSAATGSNKVLLTWTDATDKEEGYYLYRLVNNKRELAAVLPPDRQNFADVKVKPGTTQKYELVAYNSRGESQAASLSISIPKSPAFKDLGKYTWSVEAVNGLYALGAVQADASLLFKPDQLMTCKDFVKMLLTAFDIVPETEFLFSLKDMDIKDPYYPYVMTAVKLGILMPDLNGYVHPAKAVTRQEIAVLMGNALYCLSVPLNAYDETVLSRFTDADQVLPDQKALIASLCGDGILTAKTSKAMRLSSSINRAEGATILYRLIREYK